MDFLEHRIETVSLREKRRTVNLSYSLRKQFTTK